MYVEYTSPFPEAFSSVMKPSTRSRCVSKASGVSGKSTEYV